jgi:hypothetical protein
MDTRLQQYEYGYAGAKRIIEAEGVRAAADRLNKMIPPGVPNAYHADLWYGKGMMDAMMRHLGHI